MIGGKELDLHLLYGEVTKKGGFEKVIILTFQFLSFFFFFPSFGAGRLKKGDMGFVCLMIFASGVIMDRLLERRNGRM